MITEQNSNWNFKPKKGFRHGDLMVWKWWTTSNIFLLVFTDIRQALEVGIKHWYHFNRAALSFGMNAPMRYRFGHLNCGVILWVYSVSFIVVFNSTHVWTAFTPFLTLAAPFLPFFYNVETIYEWSFVDVRSTGLAAFACLLTFTGAIHVGMIFLGYGNKKDFSKRGISLIFVFLTWFFAKFSRVKVSEWFICCFVEPSIVVATGYLGLHAFADWHFAIYCWLMAFVEMSRQLSYKVEQDDLRSKTQ